MTFVGANAERDVWVIYDCAAFLCFSRNNYSRQR